MKKYLVIAVSAIALASCSNDTYLGENVENTKATGEMPLTFSMVTPNMQKDAHTEAASALNGEFIVWGEKNEAGDGSAAASGNLVFKNYRVNYTTSSAFTSTSNTKDWEYVGITPYASNVTPKATGDQTIKYWDYGASKYTFTAVSVLPADITGDKIVITKTETGSGSSDYNKGYTIDVKAGANIGAIYVADRKVIDHGTGTDRTAINAYGGVAQLTFRKLAAKIRFAIYETVPGHKVTIDQVRYNNAYQTANFGVDGSFIIPGASTSFTVTYGNGSSTGPENKAITAVAGSNTQSYFETTGSPLMTADPIATSSASPTYDRALGAYTEILPNTSNATNITLDIDYTITSTDGSGEVITVENATAVIPAAYCKWQSNYAYTYIFKISDNTNGNTGTIGTDPRGLYPITFDALVTNTENGNQEVITTVSEPSITTLGVIPTSRAIRTGGSEYAPNDTIYATIEDGGSLVTLTPGKNIKLYTVATDDVDNFPITEAAVAQRLATGPVGSHLTCTSQTVSESDALKYNIVNTLPSETSTSTSEADRQALGDYKAIKWIGGVATTTYAVEYIKISSTTLALGTSLVGYYTDAACTTSAAPGGNETVSDASVTYYKIDSKTYKIVKVQ